jgi:Tat protein secretion system quality control protein TatD with DNase activity
MPFSLFLHETEAYLEKYPFALVGEVGLDKSFRIPEPYTDTELALGLNRDEGLTPGGREGRKLSAFRVDKEHQKMIFKMQLQLAAKKGRGVSVHGVQAHGLVFDVLKELWAGHEREGSGSKRERRKQKQRSNNTGLADGEKSREVQVQGTNANTADGDANTVNAEPEKDKKIDPPPGPPRGGRRAYSGNPSSFSQYLSPTNSIPIQIFASFSTAINLSDIPSEEETPQSFADMVRMVPDHMVLVESDLHIAGEDMDNRMEDIVRRVCGVKGWALDEGVRKLGENWRRFVFG